MRGAHQVRDAVGHGKAGQLQSGVEVWRAVIDTGQ